MPGSHLYRTEAIIYRHARFGEADRVLSLFTPEYGKLRVVAKGVLRPTSHLAGHLEVFSRSNLLLVRSANLDLVTQAQSIEGHAALRESLSKTSLALYAAELLDRVSEDHQENEMGYELFCSFLGWLTEAREPDLLVRHFEMRLLDISGYRPELYFCLACREALEPAANAFSPAAGGVLCAGCASGDPQAYALSLPALKVLRLLQRNEVGQILKLHTSAALSRELEHHIRCYLPHIIERQVRSAEFVDAVRDTERLAGRVAPGARSEAPP